MPPMPEDDAPDGLAPDRHEHIPEDLRRTSARTLAHYDRHAQAFWEGTRHHDVRQNIDALLSAITSGITGSGATAPPFELLDFGCGPGRDLATFTALGHRATGLEGSPPLAALARAHSGCTVLEQNFLALQLPTSHFDGIFANASLFHVPSAALPRVLRQLHAALKPGGVLFSSNPRGPDHGVAPEGWNGERYAVQHGWPAWLALLRGAGFEPLHHFYRPDHLPLEQRPWLASVWRKPAR